MLWTDVIRLQYVYMYQKHSCQMKEVLTLKKNLFPINECTPYGQLTCPHLFVQQGLEGLFCKESTNKESCHSLSSVVEEVPLLVWTSVEDVMLLIFLFFSALVVTSVAVS